MKRLNLLELHDCAWFPSGARDCVTIYLQFLMEYFRPYSGAAPLLLEALESIECNRVIDLCSGAGGPLPSLNPYFASQSEPYFFTLSDKYPNQSSVEYYAKNQASIQYLSKPLDCLLEKEIPSGFRTMFTAFHHFPPVQAQAILKQAVLAGSGIAIFEVTERKLVAYLRILLVAILMPFVLPFLRGVKSKHLFWTYVLPLAPLSVLFDGMVSNIRTYKPAELQELATGADSGCPDQSDFRWQSGTRPSSFGTNISYLIGVPERLAAKQKKKSA